MFRENISVWKSCEHSWDSNHSSHFIFSWFRFNLLEALVDTPGVKSLWASLWWAFLFDLEKPQQGTLLSVKRPVTYFPPPATLRPGGWAAISAAGSRDCAWGRLWGIMGMGEGQCNTAQGPRAHLGLWKSEIQALLEAFRRWQSCF